MFTVLTALMASLFFSGAVVLALGKSSQYRMTLFIPDFFQNPLLVLPYPGEKKGLYAVVEKKGRIYLAGPESKKTLFLDIEADVCDKGYEEGLLGLAFDPLYRQNKTFFIYYSVCNPRASVVERVRAGKTAAPANILNREVILRIAQPYANHNGGHLVFGPDRMLYIGLGDGGAGGDPHGNAQNTDTLLGKILRIDVSGETGYEIPRDNPHLKNGRPEIFAFGLRNPWRFSFDSKTGLLWAGDVGQDRYEEITIIRAGENHGWNVMEGNHCFLPAENCREEGLVLPVYEYSHNKGRSVTGGFVYRGDLLPELRGQYIFGDFVNGAVWSIPATDPKSGKGPAVAMDQANTLLETDMNISSFGFDDQRVLMVDYFSGRIYQMIANP